MSSCGAPRPKPGTSSGRMSGSGGWQVSSPLQAALSRGVTVSVVRGRVKFLEVMGVLLDSTAEGGKNLNVIV